MVTVAQKFQELVTVTMPEIPRIPETKMHRRRLQARLNGLCIVCCKQKPPEGRGTCVACGATAKVRMSHRRERQRLDRFRIAKARAYREAGDNAYARFAYVEAAMQYERGLKHVEGCQGRRSETEKWALLEKSALAALRGVRPESAMLWLERELNYCLSTESLHEQVPYVIREMARHRWIDLQTPEALSLLRNAYERATNIPKPRQRESFLWRIDTLTARCLTLLGRYSEAAQHFSPGKYREPRRQYYDSTKGEYATISRAVYINQQAICYAISGKAPEAIYEFERAAHAAKRFTDGYDITTILEDCADWAIALGRLDSARASVEQALFIARERHIGWRIPYLTLRIARIFIKIGEYEQARLLLKEVLTHDTQTPVLRVLRSILTLELSHILRDPDLVRSAVDNEALELAFQSGEPRHIAPLISAHVRTAISSGNARRAKQLISRALRTIGQADHAVDLLALCARYGSLDDAEQAKRQLIERIRLPHHRVAQAYLNVWETQMALRRHTTGLARHHAEKAARIFARLGWKHERAETLGLVGIPSNRKEPHVTKSAALIFGRNIPALTNRERQVAEYVIKGLTNKAIADVLEISEHTVEAHMTSILGRLGLHSRWQLIQPQAR